MVYAITDGLPQPFLSAASSVATSFSRRSRTTSCSLSSRSTKPFESAASFSPRRAAARSPFNRSFSPSRVESRESSFSIFRSRTSKTFVWSIPSSSDSDGELLRKRRREPIPFKIHFRLFERPLGRAEGQTDRGLHFSLGDSGPFVAIEKLQRLQVRKVEPPAERLEPLPTEIARMGEREIGDDRGKSGVPRVARRPAAPRDRVDEDLGGAHSLGQPTLLPLSVAHRARDSEKPAFGAFAARRGSRRECVGAEGFPRQPGGICPGLEQPLEESLDIEEVRRARGDRHAPVRPDVPSHREGESPRLEALRARGITLRSEATADLEEGDLAGSMPEVARDRVQETGKKRRAQVAARRVHRVRDGQRRLRGPGRLEPRGKRGLVRLPVDERIGKSLVEARRDRLVAQLFLNEVFLDRDVRAKARNSRRQPLRAELCDREAQSRERLRREVEIETLVAG